MEIRFSTDDSLEEKMTLIMDKLKFKSKKDLVTYLINREFDDIIKAEMKKV